jgi:hypothetical protein
VPQATRTVGLACVPAWPDLACCSIGIRLHDRDRCVERWRQCGLAAGERYRMTIVTYIHRLKRAPRKGKAGFMPRWTTVGPTKEKTATRRGAPRAVSFQERFGGLCLTAGASLYRVTTGRRRCRMVTSALSQPYRDAGVLRAAGAIKGKPPQLARVRAAGLGKFITAGCPNERLPQASNPSAVRIAIDQKRAALPAGDAGGRRGCDHERQSATTPLPPSSYRGAGVITIKRKAARGDAGRQGCLLHAAALLAAINTSTAALWLAPVRCGRTRLGSLT